MKGRPPRYCPKQQQQHFTEIIQRQSSLNKRLTYEHQQLPHNLNHRMHEQQAQPMTTVTNNSDFDVFCSSTNSTSSGYGIPEVDNSSLPFVDWDRLEKQLKTALKLDESSESVSFRERIACMSRSCITFDLTIHVERLL